MSHPVVGGRHAGDLFHVGGRHAGDRLAAGTACSHSTARDSRLDQQLADYLKGQICLLGIGNRQWRDDGVGSYIAEALQSRTGFHAIDVGCVPENYLETAAGKNPDIVLMIDATDFGGTPGEFRLMEMKNVAHSGLSTHAGSLHILAKYLQFRTGARIALLAIQPADTSAGEILSPRVAATACYLRQILAACYESPAWRPPT